MTPATKSIKVTPLAHKALKVEAAKRGIPVYELVDSLVITLARLGVRAKNGSKKERTK